MFGWLAEAGGVGAAEMLRVFNCGIGMALVVRDAELARSLLADLGEQPIVLGQVEARLGPAAVVLEPK